MKRYSYCILGLTILGFAGSCGGDDDGGPSNPLGDVAKELAKQCGLACPGDKDNKGEVIKGVLEGNASISGNAQVDAFFASANNFRGAADSVAAGIKAQLDLIRGDFGIDAKADLAAELKAKIAANVEGSLTIDYQPPVCTVDASATIEAQARCEANVNPGKLEVECKGSCELEAGAELKCDAGAELSCEFNGPTVNCQGECHGTCNADLMVAAECTGTCRGACTGACSAYSDAAGTMCAGSCSGMCTGKCEATVKADAMCTGVCNGSCEVSGPEAKCEGAAHVSCKAKAGASVMCKGKCEGDFEPPSASAECKASAKAEAKLNVQCTPPAIAVRYRLKAGVNAMAQAQFEAAVKTLVNVRLPALTAALKRGDSIGSAGADLGDAATGAVKAAVDTAIKGNVGIRAKFGLGCALGELPKVEDALAESADALNDQLKAGLSVTGALGMPNS